MEVDININFEAFIFHKTVTFLFSPVVWFIFLGISANFQEAGSSLSAEESASYGDNLLGPFLHTGRAKPTLMIDWPKALVSQAVFHGYTTSGMNTLFAPWYSQPFQKSLVIGPQVFPSLLS